MAPEPSNVRWVAPAIALLGGSGVTTIEVVDSAVGRWSRKPAVSGLHRGAELAGDFATLAWDEISASWFFSLGDIEAQRTVFTDGPNR